MARNKSRAARLSEALSAVNVGVAEDAVRDIREYAEKLEAVRDEALEDPDTARVMPQAPAYDAADLGTDATCAAETVGELQDEIENWKSGMEGTNLENTQKYSDLEECASALEEIKDALEGVSVPTRPTVPEAVGFITDDVIDAWNGYADELEQAADEVQSALDNEGNISFPGMF